MESLPKKRQVVVQKYLSNPYLINGFKFDLRIYVFVASFDPLRIYLFDDGLTRFASKKYDSIFVLSFFIKKKRLRHKKELV
jgi:tubulin polyglutamylase TTLL4